MADSSHTCRGAHVAQAAAKQDATPWALPLDKGLVPSGPGTCFFTGSTCRLPQETLQITHSVKKDEHGKPTFG